MKSLSLSLSVVLPIELDARRGDSQTGLITINLLGQYQATLTIAEPVP